MYNIGNKGSFKEMYDLQQIIQVFLRSYLQAKKENNQG